MPKENQPSESTSYAERRESLKETFAPTPVLSQTTQSLFDAPTYGVTLETLVKEEPDQPDVYKDFLKRLSSDTPEAKAFLDQLAQVLKNPELEALKAECQVLQTMIQKYRPSTLVNLFKEITDNGREKINTNYDKTKNLFDDEAFGASIKTLYDKDIDIALIQKKLSSSLEKTHKEQLAQYDKSNQEQQEKLHAAAQRDTEAFIFLKNLYKNDKKMLNQWIAAQEEAQKDKGAELCLDEQGCKFSSDDLKSLEKIRHLGGLFGFKEHMIQKNDKGEYELNMGKPIAPWNIAYYLFDQNKKHLLDLATLVRLAGHDTIHVKVANTNDDMGRETARRAYEACIKAGFSPEKITLELTVKGKTIQMAHKAEEAKKDDPKSQEKKSIAEELFANKQALYQSFQTAAASASDKIKKTTAPYNKVSYQELHQARKAMRLGRESMQNNASPLPSNEAIPSTITPGQV